jgi:ornithine cyclodeaminase/alanine dehydrogenase-like protein (mu-crystallin family)
LGSEGRCDQKWEQERRENARGSLEHERLDRERLGESEVLRPHTAYVNLARAFEAAPGSHSEITLFKSVGVAVADVVAADPVWRAARHGGGRAV